ncbi:MAG: FAD-dependent oxidoreductase [Gemmatimonadota bacterium]|jgi:thioredoxin reductase (NADPH)
MAKPAILAVDDEPEVLNAIARDLRQHYRDTYRVMKAGSGAEALETVRELKRRGTSLALLLVDERMPAMTGTEFLVEALKLYPDTRRVLLTAYADTDTAITAINRIGIDHYLLKPWEPPHERLYPVLDDLLSEWYARMRPEYDGLRVAGVSLSAASYRVRDFLAGYRIPYRWLDVDTESTVREMVAAASPDGALRVPVVFFPDGSVLVQPDTRELADKLGFQTQAERPFYDLVIVGGGPAGLAGAVYAASEGLRTVLVERKAPGGQAGTSSRIENYLGFPSGLSGADLAHRATTQARRFGAELLAAQDVVGIERADPYRTVKLADGSELSCYAVLYTAGMEVRELDAPGVSELVGAGIYYGAALTEGAAHRGKDVFVVGGANSAGQGAIFFSKYARKVTILVRGVGLTSMSQYLVDRIEQTPNIEVLPRTTLAAAEGESGLERITLANADSGEECQVAADGVFIFIGSAPRTDLLGGLVECDAEGFILTGRDTMREGRLPPGWEPEREPYFYETSVPGIFAAGDVRHGSGKRVATAVGEGSSTISMVHQYLETV